MSTQCYIEIYVNIMLDRGQDINIVFYGGLEVNIILYGS